MSTRKTMNFTENDVRNVIRSKRLLVKTGKLKPKENPWIVDDEARLLHAIRMTLYVSFGEIDFDKICKGNKAEEDEVIKELCRLLADCPLHKPSRVPSLKKTRKLWAEILCTSEKMMDLRMDNAKVEREMATKRVVAKYRERLNVLRQSNKPVDEINKGVCEIVCDRDRELSDIQRIGLDERNPTDHKSIVLYTNPAGHLR